jgi:RNA-directed DNA polymerase
MGPEGKTLVCAMASVQVALRGQRPLARVETSCARTGRARNFPLEMAQGDAPGRPKAASRRCTVAWQSYNSIVPAKPPNKVTQVMAEAAEERELTKKNTPRQNIPRTQCRTDGMPSALERVRQAARRSRNEKFSSLMHHITTERLKGSFLELKRDAQPGVDRVTWKQYAEDLDDNVESLHVRLQNGAYRAKPSLRTYIPKRDGRQRPLGIAALEDKMVPRATTEVLNAIYEVDFLGFSYGFRPGRQAHQALDALAIGIRYKKISWIRDADVRNYFGSIDHNGMINFREHRIADKRLLRLIRKWLKAGVIEDGKWFASEEGSPQGASISPLLSNVCLHYVLDMWVQQWRQRCARGEVIIVRWADDFVVGFQYKDDAERFHTELCDRFKKFSRELHPDKTRLIRFGRFARDDSKRLDGRKKPETFHFLGFTHCCGITRDGKFIVCRITTKKRLKAKLRAVKIGLRKRMHQSIGEQATWLSSVIRGYYQYHAIPGNYKAISTFQYLMTCMWYKTLKRRSPKSRLHWKRMEKITAAVLPRPQILHPWPEQRYAAMIQGRNPVR